MDDDDVSHAERPPDFHPCKDVEFNPKFPTAAAVLLLYEPLEVEER
mgnify:CR=1 FL=1|jgi:hypothetical protein